MIGSIDVLDYREQLRGLFERVPQLSDIKPSAYAEQNVIIPGKGYVDYNYNPYCKEPIDRLAPDDPARVVAVMKGSQITFSSGVIYPGLGYIIKENPGNTYLQVGTSDLVAGAVEKLDLLIQNAKLQDYIGSQIERRKNRKSGDTDVMKNFTGGYVKIGSPVNAKSIAQESLLYIFLDDYDAMKGRHKEGGDLMTLLKMRAASFKDSYKMYLISTPLNEVSSNIEPAFEYGDQRYWHVECPCCHEPIVFRWEVKEGDVMNSVTEEVAKCNGGIVFERDHHNRLIDKSVGYVCYKCGGWFDDRNKQDQLRGGYYISTAVSKSDDYYSYHVSALYAPVGMFSWKIYAQMYIDANPIGQPRLEHMMKTFMNTCLGLTYKPKLGGVEAKKIMSNTRRYAIGTIPEEQSLMDGNGRIVALLCAADMNGKMAGYYGAKVDDVRLDYELVAVAENGATYSIDEGSIGTFKSGMSKDEQEDPDRAKWTYDHNKPNSVWAELDKVITKVYPADTGRQMQVMLTGLDSGVYSSYAYEYIDERSEYVVGLKGKDEVLDEKGDKNEVELREGIDRKYFKPALERPNLYVLEVGKYKDRLKEFMDLNWSAGHEDQPSNFMNFPQPSGGKYGYEDFFKHYESEGRVEEKTSSGNPVFRWKKKRTDLQNHKWDCRVYLYAVKDILVWRLGRSPKVKKVFKNDFTWADFVGLMKRKYGW